MEDSAQYYAISRHRTESLFFKSNMVVAFQSMSNID